MLFALAILVLLSVFSLSFVSVMRLERLAATNLRLQTQAMGLAEAGVAQACAEAREAARRRMWNEPRDWWANGRLTPDPLLSAGHALAANAFGGLDRFQVVSIDAASKLDVNLPTPGLPRALELLGVTPAEVDTLVAARRIRGRLRSRDELHELLGEARWIELRDLITVHTTRRPTANSTGSAQGRLPWNYDEAPWSASPININAASEAVLAAVLANVEGHAIEVQGRPVAAEWLRAEFRAERGWAGGGPDLGISEPMGQRLARELVACRTRSVSPVTGILYGPQPFAGAFRTWGQLDAFLASLQGNLLEAPERALIMSLVEPNARFMGYNPDASRRGPGGLFDRTGATRLTTTLSLCGSGILEVRSRGWITDGTDLLVAEAEVDRVVRVFTPLQLTSQLDLESAWAGTDRTTYQLMPELLGRSDVPESADPVDGHLRLTSENTVVGGEPALSTAFRGPGAPDAPYSFPRPPATLRAGGTLAPDGAVVWRFDRALDGATLATGGLPTSLAQVGSFELWFKLAGDPSVGTDEALLSVIIDDTESWTPALRSMISLDGYSLPSRMGATVKLERFRGRLRATWFYWGEPEDGCVSRFVLVLSEVQQDISAWRAGEWHHVTVSWQHSLQDMAAAATGSPLTAADVAGVDGINLWVDGRATSAVEKFDYSSMEPLAPGQGAVFFHVGRSVSTPTVESILIGGYSIAPAPGEFVHGTGTTQPERIARYTNGTIDDVFVYLSPVGGGGAVPRNADLRFERNGAGVAAPFDLPVGFSYEVGCVAATVEVPPGCQASLRLPGGGTEVSALDAIEPLILDAQSLLGQVTAGRLRVELVLTGDGVTTPLLEDFNLLLLGPIELIEERRDPL